MNALLKTISDAHAEFDYWWKLAREKQNVKLTCSKDCSACCYEPCYVGVGEVDLMLEHLPADELDGVVGRTRDWKLRAQSSGLLKQEQPAALDWLAARIPCPMLKNGLCLVYENRPIGCRSHCTDCDPKDCSGEGRAKQVYVFPKELMDYTCAKIFQVSQENDHLGAFLVRRLLDEEIETAAHVQFELV